MKVVFIKDAPGNGRKGELKEVSDGFAKNFLIAKGLAQAVTPQLMQKLEKEKKEQDQKRQKEAVKQQMLKTEIEKRVFPIKVKIGDQGQVFGGVHEKEVAKVISDKLGEEIGKNQVEIKEALKTPGEHSVTVKLMGGVLAKAKINIEPS